ncbi:hypothetical protein CHS0354_001552 [Potamilus streckersoni]|uniref:LIM zinc-binding domain-containing protein n=1 Tax=Potamilus streckersoni TaxID=2493646 RepID=A0AAE0SMJ3_9BIVA|nr:hypothetical protein CHS0354_001552 [Potamilus streckersoni]
MPDKYAIELPYRSTKWIVVSTLDSHNIYLRLFGSNGSCVSCGQSIPASELVMRSQGNVYHVKCFVCVTCHNQLTPGDRYGVVNGSILCEQDYPKVLKGQQTLNGRPSPKVQFSTTGIV